MAKKKETTTNQEIWEAVEKVESALAELRRLLSKEKADELDIALKNKKVKESRTEKVLKQWEMPKHLSGYKFWFTAIIICLDNPRYMSKGLMKLYDEIGEKHKVDSQTVIRAMKTAIGNCKVMDSKDLKKITFKNGAISNAKILQMMIDQIADM